MEHPPGATAARAPAAGGPGGARPARLLVAVAAVYAAASLALTWRLRFGWDETVYLSQVARDVPAAFFSAPRARGVSWLAAPVAAFTTATWAVRTWLAVVAGVLTVAAWWPWLRLRAGHAVPLAAAAFAVLWPALFYGAQAMPNHWVALAGVGAVGWFLRAVGWFLRAGAALPAGGTGAVGRALAGVAAFVAAATVLRPSDAVWLALPLTVAALVAPPWRRRRAAAALAAGAAAGGFALGALPWLIEAITSYGGPLERLHRASEIQGGTGPTWNVITTLRAVDGPSLCRPCTRPVPPTGVLLWLAGAALVALGLATARRERRVASTVLPAVVGIGAAVPYLFFIGYAAPRFLLPAYGLLAVPAADGLLGARRLAAERVRPAAVTATLAVLVVGLVAYQGAVAAASVRGSQRQRDAWAAVVAVLHERGVRPPCVVSGDQAPPIGFYSGCASRQPGGHDQSITQAGLRRLAAVEPVALIRLRSADRPAWAAGWRTVRVPTPPYGTWRVHLSPNTAPTR